MAENSKWLALIGRLKRKMKMGGEKIEKWRENMWRRK
jgi:hypothetical protein